MTTVEVLRAARSLLEDPTRWRQGGGFAVDAAGGVVPPRSPDAIAWCLLGAISKVTAGLFTQTAAESALYRALGRGSLITWQDRRTTTHSMLMELFAKAIHAEMQT